MRIITNANTLLEFTTLASNVGDQLETPTSVGDVLDTFDSIVSECFEDWVYEGRNLGLMQYERTNRYAARIDVTMWVADNDEDKAHTLIMTYELFVKRDTLELDTLSLRETKHYGDHDYKWKEMSIDYDENDFRVAEYEQHD